MSFLSLPCSNISADTRRLRAAAAAPGANTTEPALVPGRSAARTTQRRSRSTKAVVGAACCSLALLSHCAPATQGEAAWPQQAKQWYERAQASYRALDVEDAARSAAQALELYPGSSEVRLLIARIALADLDYRRVVELLAHDSGGEASALRARALWYSGEIDAAADELDALLADPTVRDPWGDQAAKLARQGRGRTPFRIGGGLLAVSEMPHAGTHALIVPLELNGEPALGLLDTGKAEVVVDGAEAEPSWVALRFGGRVEVKDVPAFKADLSGISREVGAPIKVLIGVDLLRRLNATFDFRGSQFVVRTYETVAPPGATTLKVHYLRGHGMALMGRLGESKPPSALLINTGFRYPLALDEAGWQKGGVTLSSLKPLPEQVGFKQGLLPSLVLGAFAVPDVPGVLGFDVEELEKGFDVDWDGVLGAGLLAAFRVTLGDGGRTMWLEDAPQPEGSGGESSGEPPANPG